MARSSLSDPAQRIELTERQEAVIRLIEKGLTNAEIADRLGVTLSGVKWHVREIIGKFGVTSRDEAVECWREHRTSGRHTRMWAGALWGSMAFRWVGGAAVLAGAGVAGTAVTLSAFQSSEEPAEEPPAVAAVAAPTPSPTPAPDLSANQGLTLAVVSVRADDTQTQIEISLEGRPELGRIFGLESKAGPGPNLERVRVVDDGGTTYYVSVGENDGDGRRERLFFGPVSPNTRWLELIIPAVSFVAPEDEPAPGEPPPHASSTVDGPWRVRIHEVPRTDVVRHALNLEPLPLGHGTAVPFEVIHTADATLLGIRFEGIEEWAHEGFIAWPYLRWPSGELVSWRNGGTPRNDSQVRYATYEPTHGEVTLRLVRQIVSGLPDNVCVQPGDQNCISPELNERLRPEAEARKAAWEALFAEQPEPTWTFTIP